MGPRFPAGPGGLGPLLTHGQFPESNGKQGSSHIHSMRPNANAFKTGAAMPDGPLRLASGHEVTGGRCAPAGPRGLPTAQLQRKTWKPAGRLNTDSVQVIAP